MEMTIDDIIQGLKETIIICNSVFAYDRKKYIDGAIDRLNKYQVMQDDYKKRLKADMVAMLDEIQLEIEELDPMGNEWSDSLDACNELIQQKINSLKGVEDGNNE